MPGGRRATVLVVDDDRAICTLVEAILDVDSTVCVAASIHDVPAATKRESPDLVLLDVFGHTDHLDALITQARAIKPDLAITLFTALSRNEAETIQERLPDVGLLRKPFDVDDLLVAVERALGSPQENRRT